jgi:hypothetical protein
LPGRGAHHRPHVVGPASVKAGFAHPCRPRVRARLRALLVDPEHQLAIDPVDGENAFAHVAVDDFLLAIGADPEHRRQRLVVRPFEVSALAVVADSARQQRPLARQR